MIRSLVLVCFFSFDCQAASFTLYTHSSQNESYTDQNGQLRGEKNGGYRALLIELVYQVAMDIGEPWNLTDVPFARGMKELEKKQNVVFFSVVQRESNIDKFKWAGPIMRLNVALYESASLPEKVTRFEDAKKAKSICVLNGTLAEQELLRQGFKNIFPHSSYKKCVKMLLYGRVDLVALPNMSVYQELIKPGLCGIKVRKTPVYVLHNHGYIAFSDDTADVIVKKWQTSLDKIIKSPVYSSLERRMLPSINLSTSDFNCR